MLLNCGVGEDSWGPLDCKEIQSVHPKGNQSWIFTGRTDAEAEAPILWPPDAKNWLIGKDPDAGKDWRQEKGKMKDEMVGWHHQFNGQEFEQASGAGDGQGSLACCSPWGHKELDTTEWLNWTDTFLKPSFLETLIIRFLPIGVDMMWCELPVLPRMDFKFILPCFHLPFSKIISVVLMKLYQS